MILAKNVFRNESLFVMMNIMLTMMRVVSATHFSMPV